MRKILLFVNPMLQRTRARRRDIERIRSAFQTAGVAVDVLETGEDRAAGPKAKLALAQGFDAIIVCGGDGTLFDVIQGMAGSSVPVGVIPFGTGNVMAQNLKVPRDPVAAAHWLMRSRPLRVPLGRVTCCAADGGGSWLFAMAAGMGVHAALMSEARRSGKDVTGKAAYFVAGGRLLLNHPVQPFEIAITTVSGTVVRERVCEALALRVAELNRWRTGGGLALPFLRLASIAGASRLGLARGSFQALFGSGGLREGGAGGGPLGYHDVMRVECRPIPDHTYAPPIAFQADGEVLGTSGAVIEMAGLDLLLLANP